jgi:hypothetical protein
MAGRAFFQLFVSWFVVLLGLDVSLAGQPATPSTPAFVRSLLDAPQAELDFARAKLAVDAFADSSIDQDTTLAEIDSMVATVERMIATLPPEAASRSAEKMKALRTPPI